mmetsp:Transcript_98980/g.171526  ORF Transcript_98980/g.171526 Transcript_98980/m.171526 type:complete len:295 (-) Transcript_98980:19-903(-)
MAYADVLVVSICFLSLNAAEEIQKTKQDSQQELMRRERGEIKSHIPAASALELFSDSSQHRWALDTVLLRMFGFEAGREDGTIELFNQLDETLKAAGFTKYDVEPHTTDDGALALQTQRYDEWAKSGYVRTVCETGFNAGHSALRFLAQSDAHLYEFDLGDHPYGKVAANFLTGKFPGRLNITWGSSTDTLRRFHAEHPDVTCDLIIVDGGHFQNVSISDLTNFAVMASKNHILAMDDTPCAGPWCVEPTESWKNLTSVGCIEQTASTRMGKMRGFSVGRYKPCSRWPDARNLA